MTYQVMGDPGQVYNLILILKNQFQDIFHASTTRLYFRKSKGANWVANIQDSPMLPEGKDSFSIGNGGINEANE